MVTSASLSIITLTGLLGLAAEVMEMGTCHLEQDVMVTILDRDKLPFNPPPALAAVAAAIPHKLCLSESQHPVLPLLLAGHADAGEPHLNNNNHHIIIVISSHHHHPHDVQLHLQKSNSRNVYSKL